MNSTGHRPYRLRNRAPHEMARVICEEVPPPLSVVITRPDDLLPSGPVSEEATTLNALCARAPHRKPCTVS